jgi:hypothetical protein
MAQAAAAAHRGGIVGAVTGTREAPERLVLAIPGKGGRLMVAGATTALTQTQAREVSALLRPPRAGRPWPPELPAGRLGAFARDPPGRQLGRPAPGGCYRRLTNGSRFRRSEHLLALNAGIAHLGEAPRLRLVVYRICRCARVGSARPVVRER